MNTLLKSLLLFLSTLCCASASAVEKVDLFEAGKEGYALYRIPGIVVTRQGTVLAYCEARKSDRGDWGPIDVLMRRSTDGGKTWGPRQKIVHVEGDLPINPLAAAQNLDKPGDNTVNNPVAIVDHETGAVHFLYCLEYMRCFYMRSDDDGATWTEPVEITKAFEDFRSDYDWKVLATGPSHAIQLTHGPKRGRLVVPVWLSLGTGGHAHRPSVTATIYSDDHGRTWQRGDIAVPDTPEFIYPNETVIVQLADGRVMLNTRSESKAHRRLVTISPDGATGWSQPRFDEQLLEPICMAGIVRVRKPQGDKPGVIAFSNPHNLSRTDGKETPGKSRNRINVTIKLSDDEGQTWSASRTLEPGFSGYSDLAALPDGTILCFYERGSTDGKDIYRTGLLTVARFSEAWVREPTSVPPNAGAARPLRILPLGDSITRGTYLRRYEDGPHQGQAIGLPQADGGGYRKPLQDQLRAAGLDFDFVGELNYGAYGKDGVVDPRFDPDHHGLAGFGNAGILSGGTVPTPADVLAKLGTDNVVVPGIVAVLEKHQPDVILMMAGANGFDDATRDKLIRTIGEHSAAHLFVATILPQKPPRGGWELVAYNASLPAIVESQRQAGKKITLVKMHAAISPDDLLADGVHPDKAGLAKVAGVWFESLVAAGVVTAGKITADPTHDADVCVYGGTSGGVVAAVQAARMGKRVVLVEPGRHLGGMTSGGLSAVDIGEPRSVGGIAREYFSRLVASYGKTLNWDEPFQGKGGPATGGAYSIEPHVAERVFEELVKEAGVTVLRDARLASVKKENARIVELTTDDGRTIRAKMFLDTTYEGDLLAAAGVSYTVMREGNAKYGETYNGIHYAEKYKPRVNHSQPGSNGRVPGGQGVWDRDFPLDPYVVKGDPTSGLLPLVSDGEPGKPGDPAPGVMAYCFRLCLSTADDRLPIEPPSDYDPKDYELVARFIAACQANGDDMDLRWFSKHDPLPNQKWDFNTATFGGNLPGGQSSGGFQPPLSHGGRKPPLRKFGGNWEWPEASYDRRAEIAKEIENYHRGLLHFLATDPRVPEKVRTDVARFGLPRDEFPDTGGWPHQLYIREGRRMVSDLVLTEHHTFGREVAPKPIGLGSYGTDIHEIRRIAKDGVAIREGKVAGGRGGFGPYQIGYGAIVPKQAECENLFATFALSASHSAFASLRMEPVFMVTSQSAATAACLAIDEGIAVQKVDYEKLQTHLLADGQVLSWPPAGVPTAAAAPRTIIRAESLPGIVLDDDQAEYQGAWTTSNRQPSPIGASYRHDDNKGRGEKIATFTATIPQAGDYEIRLLFTWHENRSSRTQVTVTGAAEEKTLRINQREPAMKDRVPNALGIFRFETSAKVRVTVSNQAADGYVVVDGLQILPIEIAREEREGKRPSGYAEIEMAAKPVPPDNAMAARVALSPLAKETRPTRGGDTDTRRSDEPVRLKQTATPAEVDGKEFDVVVIGGTGGGVACAVRAAREGCRVLLVQHNGHVGGMMTNGLMQWDALYGGPRSPIFTEMLQNIERYYIETFGRDSKTHQTIRCTHEHYPISWAEPHVAEREYNRLLAAEENITLLLDHYPISVKREGRLIRSVDLGVRRLVAALDLQQPASSADRTRIQSSDKSEHSKESAVVSVRGTTFVDATYEGDLFALAGVEYRVGREARDEYNEPHAGKVFANIDHTSPLSVTREGLNIRSYNARQGSVDPSSPFSADGAVQAYNYRFCVTSDPANRLPIPRPANYDRNQYVDYGRKYIASPNGPNHKSHVNSPILPGENHDYPNGDWDARDRITQRHLEFGLGLMWFLQNDESIPLERRKNFQVWGLPKDEYADNSHVPYEMYVRETRRIVGRHVFTENDGSLAVGYARTPIHSDSIAITDWYMDSHSCTTDSRPGFKYDGKLILTEQSRPSQIPYRSLLPREIDNLLVPVCLSATHIAWGAVRLEPVFMQTGEAAGFAAALAKHQGVAPAQLDADLLVRTLVEHRQLVSFFNDLKVTDPEPVIPAAQYFATRGFFHSYDAALHAPLTEATAKVWRQGFAELQSGNLDPQDLAARVARAAADTDSPPTEQSRGEEILKIWKLLCAR